MFTQIKNKLIRFIWTLQGKYRLTKEEKEYLSQLLMKRVGDLYATKIPQEDEIAFNIWHKFNPTKMLIMDEAWKLFDTPTYKELLRPIIRNKTEVEKHDPE